MISSLFTFFMHRDWDPVNTSLHAGLTSSVIHHVLSTESFINYFIHIVLLYHYYDDDDNFLI